MADDDEEEGIGKTSFASSVSEGLDTGKDPRAEFYRVSADLDAAGHDDHAPKNLQLNYEIEQPIVGGESETITVDQASDFSHFDQDVSHSNTTEYDVVDDGGIQSDIQLKNEFTQAAGNDEGHGH